MTINCSEGEAGKAIGCVTHTTNVIIDEAFDSWVKNVKLNLVKGQYDRKIISVKAGDKVTINGEDVKGATNLIEKWSSKGGALAPTDVYRLFYEDVYFTYLMDNGEKTIKIGDGGTSEPFGNTKVKEVSIGATKYQAEVSRAYN